MKNKTKSKKISSELKKLKVKVQKEKEKKKEQEVQKEKEERVDDKKSEEKQEQKQEQPEQDINEQKASDFRETFFEEEGKFVAPVISGSNNERDNNLEETAEVLAPGVGVVDRESGNQAYGNQTRTNSTYDSNRYDNEVKYDNAGFNNEIAVGGRGFNSGSSFLQQPSLESRDRTRTTHESWGERQRDGWGDNSRSIDQYAVRKDEEKLTSTGKRKKREVF
jgi:hypothetical protein